MERRFLLFLGTVAGYLPVLLLSDRPGLLPQIALGAATAAVLWLFVHRGPIEARQIVTVIVVATTGECVLSLAWGLYTYRNALIPLYVPFGHGIFYALAAESAQQHALRRMTARIMCGVLAGGTIIAVASLVIFHDLWGFLWWLIAATLLLRSRNQLLLSACFVYTILLEWLGTAIGNWRWAPEVPFVGLPSANPPSGVSVLYILLDMITVAICASLFARCVDAKPIGPEAPGPAPPDAPAASSLGSTVRSIAAMLP